MLLLGLLSCKTVEDIQSALEDLEGATENTIIEALILGVEIPDIEGVSLEDIDWHTTAQATAFLADTTNIEQVEEALVEGAAVFVESMDDSLQMREDEGGKYLLTTEDGLNYEDNGRLSITARFGGMPHEMRVRTPPAPQLPLTAEINTREELDIDLSGQGYPLTMAVVFELETGQLTWSSEPDSVEGFYDMAHPDGDLIGADAEVPQAKIPAEAFPWEGAYAIGVAGMVISQVDDFTEVNTKLSTLMAGKFQFMAACTESHALICAVLEENAQ